MVAPVEPPPSHPDRQAKHDCIDSDRDRAEQSRHKRRRHRDDSEHNPRRPSGAPVTQPPQTPAATGAPKPRSRAARYVFVCPYLI